ncbi:helix-turn-helix domain-containing protein [Acidisoma sp. S159]|uniref:helix-turn-helix domain-containing protein n=1 Tax=Acidisoma sp. S159 TaxID=1747225 RepID=UPI001C202AC5|nr:helix-turn-helix transcriptional regulator [Acidisoma sp. S159]
MAKRPQSVSIGGRTKGSDVQPEPSVTSGKPAGRKRIYSQPGPEPAQALRRGCLAKDLVAVFGDNLRAARLKSDLTQAEIADRLGITQQYLSLIETGRKNVTLRTMIALADVLGADLSAMLQRPRSGGS